MLNISCNLYNYGLLPSCLAIILSFISRVIALLFFFSPETGDTDGHFVDTRGCKNTMHNIQEMLAPQFTVKRGLFTLVIVGLLGAEAPRCCPIARGRVMMRITSPGKAQNSNFEVWVLRTVYCFSTIVKSKHHKPDHRNLGASVCGVKYEACFLVTSTLGFSFIFQQFPPF